MKYHKTIKVLKDLDYINGGQNIKKDSIFKTIECPNEYIDRYRHSIWIENENKMPIRVLEHEYQIIDKK